MEAIKVALAARDIVQGGANTAAQTRDECVLRSRKK
jgi:hypothetical protein